MRYLVTLVMLCLLLSSPLLAQRSINESFDLNGSRQVKLTFTWPELIIVREGSGSVVKITGSVSINNGENDDAFQFTTSRDDGELQIESFIKDYDKIPKRVKIGIGEEEIYFKASSMDDPSVRKYLEDNGKNYNYVNYGVIKDIKVVVEVPKGVELHVQSKYGLIEVEKFEGKVHIDSKYGGIDFTVSTSASMEIKARTKYGDVFTDLPIEMIPNPNYTRGVGKWMTVTGTVGNGSNSCTLESQYGNIYVRKAQ